MGRRVKVTPLKAGDKSGGTLTIEFFDSRRFAGSGRSRPRILTGKKSKKVPRRRTARGLKGQEIHMLDIKMVRANPDLVKQAMKTRNKDMDAQVDRVIAIDAERRELSAWPTGSRPGRTPRARTSPA